MEQTVQTNNPAATRPAFLTVLCILSFIFSGIAIILLIIGLLGMGAATALANSAIDAGGTYTGPSIGLTWAYLIIGFLTSLIGLYGVVKMWKLQKVGFYIYTACVVISMIMGIVYAGFGIMSILPLVFVVLYGLNLKAMK